MPYCQFCGTKLEEGQTCTCEIAKEAETRSAVQQVSHEQIPLQQTSSSFVVKIQTPAVLKSLRIYFLAYISNPAQAVRSVIESESLRLPIALSVVRLLAVGLTIYGFLRKGCDSALSIVKTSLMRYGNSGEILTAKISPSFPKCLLYGALIAVIGMATFAAITFILAKIHHEETNLKNILCLST